MKKFIFLFFLLFLLYPVFTLAKQIDINSADLSQLDELVHVGEKTAQKIIDGRPYNSVQDLSKIKGIGDGKYLQDIINEGLACVNCETVIASEAKQSNDKIATSPAIPRNDEIIYSDGILINEIMPSPEGTDEINEWIEIYNSNNFNVDLSGWKIKDTNGTPTTFTISENTIILASNFLIFKRPDTKITLNNDADGLKLLTPDGKIVDSVEFSKAIKSYSYSKINSDWQWSSIPTPGFTNSSSIKNVLSKTEKSVNNNIKAGLASVNQGVSTNQEKSLPASTGNKTNPWFLFLTAITLTIISAIVVLFIKFKLQKYVRT